MGFTENVNKVRGMLLEDLITAQSNHDIELISKKLDVLNKFKKIEK